MTPAHPAASSSFSSLGRVSPVGFAVEEVAVLPAGYGCVPRPVTTEAGFGASPSSTGWCRACACLRTGASLVIAGCSYGDALVPRPRPPTRVGGVRRKRGSREWARATIAVVGGYALGPDARRKHTGA